MANGTFGITKEWVHVVGGVEAASDLIKGALKCSRSKSDKIAGRRYPSKISQSERVRLKELVQSTKKCRLVGASDVSKAS